MDNITHGLLGAAIGYLAQTSLTTAPLAHSSLPLNDSAGAPAEGPPAPRPFADPTSRAVFWGAVIAAELPDLDVFIGSGPMAEYIWHRGFTHALLFAPVVALIATGLTKLLWRKSRTLTVYGWSLFSVLIAHYVNDWMTGWGTRLLLPFSQVRAGLDWVPIVDLLYTLPLLIAVLIAWRRPHKRRRAAVLVLTYLAVYTFGFRGLSHLLVDQAVQQHYAGQTVIQAKVSPSMFNPLSWTYAVELADRFEQGQTTPFGAIAPAAVLPKEPADAVTLAVRSAPELKPYFDQFSFAQVSYEQTAGGYTVTLGDLRYRIGGRGMTTRVELGQDLKVRRIENGGW